MFTIAGLEAVEASCDKLESDTETTSYLQQSTKNQESTLQSIKESLRTHGAPKPLITSTLQQEASKSFGTP